MHRIEKQTNARFSWSKGQIICAAGNIKAELHLRAKVFTWGFEGIMTEEFACEVTAESAECGRCTLLWRRAPAVRIHGEGFDCTLCVHGQLAGSGEAKEHAPIEEGSNGI